MAEPSIIRCAVYTRKSSEEGLEQSFNSLHAQREACEAYILSQKHEGWQLVPTAYDDGGYSGGSMERPGLKALMADLEAGLVDIIVVYKVDRLTRSLADFAKMVERFDARGASFVSVTQAFNTTTSMGRLTLNVLLSFAQFEREVTGEPDPRQDRRVEGQGHVDGRRGPAWLRRRRAPARRQRRRSRAGTEAVPALRQT
ncbi:recombinase family protein [Sphingomonas ginkgonis]|uniref:recombinase family protein n=1 Tax=Sphingomonas ginkgonis TaxID=2315330 RepID=UPI001C8B8290|nr:recombinase family protein [Sphingomonas ginkgonis]